MKNLTNKIILAKNGQPLGYVDIDDRQRTVNFAWDTTTDMAGHTRAVNVEILKVSSNKKYFNENMLPTYDLHVEVDGYEYVS